MVPDGIQMLDPSLRSIEIYNLLSVSAFAGYWVWAIPFPLPLSLDFCSLSRISICSVTLALGVPDFQPEKVASPLVRVFPGFVPGFLFV